VTLIGKGGEEDMYFFFQLLVHIKELAAHFTGDRKKWSIDF